VSTPDVPAPKFSANSAGLKAEQIVAAANQVIEIRVHEMYRLERIAKYMRGKHDPPYTPRGASTEYRWLTRRARDNFLPLIVSVISQNLHVDGYRPSSWSPDDSENELDVSADPGWSAWRANRMVSRQHGINRSVVKYGCAYATVLPGRIATRDSTDMMVADASMPVITPFSPRKMTALYMDDISDEWPIIAVAEYLIADRSAPGKYRRLVKVLDDTNQYILVGGMGNSPSKLAWPEPDDPTLAGQPAIASHGMGICPVVRFTYEADLDADTDCVGEVEPLISLQDQVNFHTFNQLLAEQFAAFRQRWVTGMQPVDETGRMGHTLKPGVDRLWTAEDPDTKFGEFSETNLAAISAAREDSIRHMATISQLPPYHLLGALVNLSADALSAARDGLDRKSEQLREILSDSYRNIFRLCSKAQGDVEGWDDLYGSVLWKDTSARSFSATIDGLGKATQMLGVPSAELWRKIPGVTAEDVAAWKAAAGRADAMAAIDKVVEAAMTSGVLNQNPTPDGQPYQVGMAAPGGLQSKPLQAATPAPGAPGNETPAPDANGNQAADQSGADNGTHTVHVPAHDRSMPDAPKPKPKSKPGKPTGGTP
jgi:hypothetical protein